VIVAGGGARSSEAGPEIVELAERLSIPVATSLDGKDVISDTHRWPWGSSAPTPGGAQTASSPRRTSSLHRERNRGPGDQRLDDPADRHPCHPDRHRSV